MAGSKFAKEGTLSDLGFDAARIAELQSHASGASGAGAFGYTADTAHHFKETSDATSAGSIEADMRKIGKHLGYEHWGTANPDRIKGFIAQEQAKDPVAAAPELKEAELSNTANKSLAYTEAYDDFNRGGGGVELRAGNLDARDDFMDLYSLNLNKRQEAGTAGEFGTDSLNMHGHNEIANMNSSQSKAQNLLGSYTDKLKQGTK
jgi:hypothetical protein